MAHACCALPAALCPALPCQAVDTIHRERIVHSDLKPANFLVVEGQLKLIDFGIAKAIQSGAARPHWPGLGQSSPALAACHVACCLPVADGPF